MGKTESIKTPRPLPTASTEEWARWLAENLPEPNFSGLPVSSGGKAKATQDLADALQRDAQLRKTRAELLRALFNRAGLERLRAVTDADWREAERRDEGEN